MEPAVKLISVRGIKKIPECKEVQLHFIDYLKDLGVIKGTMILIVNRKVWKYSPAEAAIIQSV